MSALDTEARRAMCRAALVDAGRPDLADRVQPDGLGGPRNEADYRVAYRAAVLVAIHNARPAVFCWRCGFEGWLADECVRVATDQALRFETCGRWT